MQRIIQGIINIVAGAVLMYMFIMILILPPIFDGHTAQINALDAEWREYVATIKKEKARSDSVINVLQREIIKLERQTHKQIGSELK